MYCLGNFFKIFQFYRVHSFPFFWNLYRNSEHSFRKKVCGQKFFKLFLVSRGILSILQVSMAAVCQQNCLSQRKSHREITASGSVCLGSGSVWMVKWDRVINLFFEIRTWADITRVLASLVGWPEMSKEWMLSPGGRAQGLCSRYQSVGNSPHIRNTGKLVKKEIPESHSRSHESQALRVGPQNLNFFSYLSIKYENYFPQWVKRPHQNR